jgi:hypothetical protein
MDKLLNGSKQQKEIRMKCKECHKEIVGDPVVKELNISYGNSDSLTELEKKIVKKFCSDKCKSIDDILEHKTYYGNNIGSIVNHLIKDHCCDIESLEKALNTKEIRSQFNHPSFTDKKRKGGE